VIIFISPKLKANKKKKIKIKKKKKKKKKKKWKLNHKKKLFLHQIFIIIFKFIIIKRTLINNTI